MATERLRQGSGRPAVRRRALEGVRTRAPRQRWAALEVGRKTAQNRPRLAVGATPARRGSRTPRKVRVSGGMVVMVHAMASSSVMANTGRSAAAARRDDVAAIVCTEAPSAPTMQAIDVQTLPAPPR